VSANQIPLPLTPPRRPSLDNFIVGDNGALVETLRRGLQPSGWYFLVGPPGSGRSHLLAATVARLTRAGVVVAFVPLRSERGRALLDAATGDWIVVDDVDALAGQIVGERALFNALNRWQQSRSGVLMSGRGRGRFELPDLSSRLGQATRLTIRPLDESGRRELIESLILAHDVRMGQGATDYLLSRGPRNAGQLSDFLAACVGRALAEKRTLSKPIVRQQLARQADIGRNENPAANN